MARIRSTHPGQWSDEDFVACSMAARLLAIAIRNEADDQGIFEWKPLSLKMKLFPADQVDMDDMLAELVEHKHVIKFDHDGESYGAVRNFRKYQRPKKPTAIYPLPNELRTYVGLTDNGSEPVPHQDVTGTEKPPQMEDGGDNRKEEEPPVVPLAGDTTKVSRRRKPRTALPEGWEPKADHPVLAAKHGYSPTEYDWIVQNFRDECQAKGLVYADHDQAFRNWIKSDITAERVAKRRKIDGLTAPKPPEQIERERAETDAHQATIKRSEEQAAVKALARLQEAARIAKERTPTTPPPDEDLIASAPDWARRTA